MMSTQDKKQWWGSRIETTFRKCILPFSLNVSSLLFFIVVCFELVPVPIVHPSYNIEGTNFGVFVFDVRIMGVTNQLYVMVPTSSLEVF